MTWAKDTRVLRKLVVALDWAVAVRRELEEPPRCSTLCSLGCWCRRDLEHFTRREAELREEIKREVEVLGTERKGVSLLFLSLGSPLEAGAVALLEQHRGTTYTRARMAPRPEDILWQNVKSTLAAWTYFLGFFVLFVLIALFAITPVVFQNMVWDLVEGIVGTSEIKHEAYHAFAALAQSVLYFTFSLLTPYFVKLMLVRFGGWDEERVVRKYMVCCFVWQFISIIAAPFIQMTNLKNIILKMADSDGYYPNFHCMFQPSSGAFFVNYLVISALLRCPVQLHRLADLAYRLWAAATSGCSRAERAVAWRLAEQYNRTVNTYDNVGLANSYIWTLLLFAGTCLLCLAFPLASPAFLLYMAAKYAVDAQNLRLFYTAREHQPVLLRTGVQLAVAIPLLSQVTIAGYHIARDITRHASSHLTHQPYKDSPLALAAGTLVMVNFWLLVAAHTFGWGLPCFLFSRQVALDGDRRQVEDRGQVEGAWLYRDPVLATM